MGFFDFLKKFRVKKRDVFEGNIAKIRDVYLSKIEEEITKHGWKRVDILKQLFDWYTEPIAGEIRDTRFRDLYVSVNNNPAKLQQKIYQMGPIIKKLEPEPEPELTLIPILIRSNYKYEKEIFNEHKKQAIKKIVKKNEEISKNFNFDWAKKYAQDEANWITNKPRSEEQTYTVNQIRKDIDRSGNNTPLIYALKTIAQNPPENYRFGQDDVLYLKWLLDKGLIDLRNNKWIGPITGKLTVLAVLTENSWDLCTGYEDLKNLINANTIEYLNQNLTFVNFGKRTDAIKTTMSSYAEDLPLLNDRLTALSCLQLLVSNCFLIKECADEIGYRFFVKGEQMTSEVLFGYVINIIKEAGKPKKTGKEKIKKVI